MRLLLVEDDDLLGEGLVAFLRSEGHVVEWARSVTAAHSHLGEQFDAWLVDWQLPDGSGLDWLRQRRARGDTTAALMLTARDRLNDRLQGLDSGADDYIVKPFAPEELAARLRAVCRRSAGAAGPRVPIGRAAEAVEVDLAARCAYASGVRADLTGREWAVLEALTLRAGRIVSKNELEQLVLGFASELASNALEVHVSSLRRKLGPDVLATVRGMGYRVNGRA
jgi:two-component system, OmpR family, response regulator